MSSSLSLLDRSKPVAIHGIARLDNVPTPFVPAASPLLRRNTLPVKRLAGFLVILSRTNTYEGRDAALIADDLTCGFVREVLSVDLPTLKDSLLQLAARRLISACPNGGLRIDDIEGLEAFSD